MDAESLDQYKDYVAVKLDALTPIFAKAAVGNFSSNIEIPDTDDKFTELYMGIQIMLEVIRGQTEELQTLNKSLEERVHAQTHALEKQNNLLQTILKSIGDAIVVTNTEGVPTMMNRAAERVLGESIIPSQIDHETYGIFHSDIITPFPPSELPTFRAAHGEAMNDVELFIKNKNIPYGMFMSVTGRPLYDEMGKLFGGVAVFRDISVHKQLEEELNKYTKELEEKVKERTGELEQYLEVLHREEAKEKALLESIGDGVIAIDQDGNILYINQATEQMLGLHSDLVVGKSFAEVVPAENEKGEPVLLTDRPFHIAAAANKSVSRNYYYVRHDGRKIPVAVTASPILLNGRVMGLVNTFRDITNDLEIDRAKNELVSLASHQLRTPPAGIKWYAGMLLSEDVGPLNKEQRAYLEEIAFNNERMIDVVNAMLNISRLELGTFNIDIKPTDLTNVIEGVLGELTLQIAAKRLVVVKEYALDMPLVGTDPVLIRMVFQNLLFNAVKYTPAGGRIAVTCGMLGPEVHLSVSDTGCGIPKEDQGKIFTKLFRASNAKRIDSAGTGLGLYIVKRIIVELGGDVRFASQENEGTTFFITLPLVHAVPPARTRGEHTRALV